MMSRHSKPLYPPLPKLNSSDFEWSTHHPLPPPMQIADPSVTAMNVPDMEHRSPEVRPRQKLTNGRVMRRKAQLVCDFFLSDKHLNNACTDPSAHFASLLLARLWLTSSVYTCIYCIFAYVWIEWSLLRNVIAVGKTFQVLMLTGRGLTG